MVRVAEDNLRFYLVAQLTEVHCLHGSFGTYWHEDWGEDLSVVGCYYSGAGVGSVVGVLKFEFH